MIGNRALACWLGWLGLSLCGSAAPAADWPQWGGSDGKNMVSEEKGLPDSFVPGEKDPQGAGIKMETTKNVKWVARLGGLTCSTPTVAGGKVFIGTMRDEQGAFLCLDEKTGKTLWQWVAPARQVPATMDGRRFEFGRFPKQLGICSTAAVDGDRVYIVTQRLEVLCLGTSGRPKGSGASAPAASPPQGAAEKTPADPPAKGKGEKASGEKVPWPEPEREADVVWMFDIWDLGVRPSDACDCSVVVRGDFVYALTANGTDRQAELAAHDEFRKCPAPTAPNLVVLDKKTGRLVAVDDVLIAPRMLHGQWSSPSLGQVGGGIDRVSTWESCLDEIEKEGRLAAFQEWAIERHSNLISGNIPSRGKSGRHRKWTLENPDPAVKNKIAEVLRLRRDRVPKLSLVVIARAVKISKSTVRTIVKNCCCDTQNPSN